MGHVAHREPEAKGENTDAVVTRLATLEPVLLKASSSVADLVAANPRQPNNFVLTVTNFLLYRRSLFFFGNVSWFLFCSLKYCFREVFKCLVSFSNFNLF